MSAVPRSHRYLCRRTGSHIHFWMHYNYRQNCKPLNSDSFSFLFKPGYGYLNEQREERTHQSLDVSADPCSRRCVCRRTGSCTRGYKSPHSRRHTTDTQHSRCQQPRSCRGDSCLGLRGRPLQPLEGLIKAI